VLRARRAGIITLFAHAVLGSLTRAIEWLSTVWINTPTPALVGASGTATATVAWMQGEPLPLTAALAVGSIIVGGAKLAVAEAGHSEAREFTCCLFVYALASAGGVAFAAMLISTCDAFANYIIAQAMTGSNFVDHLAQGLGLAAQAVGSATLQPQGGFLLGLAGTAASAMLAIVIGLVALLASFIEFVLMAFRGACW
jgi:type IV secretion system protein TrbL